MNNIQLFQYNNTSIEFEVIDGQVFANATAMCQAFGKRPNDWLRLESTKRYLEALESLRGNHVATIDTRTGGIDRGSTWIHEKLILKLAQWLDVNFEIWCDERIAELMKHGFTATSNKLEELELLKLFKSMESRIARLEQGGSNNGSNMLLIGNAPDPMVQETKRASIRRIINQYCHKYNADYRSVWNTVYERLFYNYGVNLRVVVRRKNENILDAAERLGHIDKIYSIVSSQLK